jgi:hypothetical protein
MKTILSLSLLICFLTSSSQNDYINYNLKVYEARKLAYENKLDNALDKYKEAFALVDYIHIETLEKAKKVAIELKNDSMIAFIDSEQIKYNNKVVDSSIKILIDSIKNEDSNTRDKKYIQAQLTYWKYNEDENSNKNSSEYQQAKKLFDEWHNVDSTNIYILLNLIKQYGFPSEKLVKKDAAGSAFMVLLHFDKDSTNTILKPILDKALLEGNISPEKYAWIVDRRLSWGLGKEQYYYQMPMDTENLTPEQIKEVNERRKSIGLRDLFEGIKITTTESTMRVEQLY